MMFEDRCCFLCGSTDHELFAIVQEKPRQENDLGIIASEYYREVRRCKHCGVFNNFHDFDLESIYQGEYNRAVYQNELYEKYTRIMSLPEEKSDNKARVKRVLAHCKEMNLDIPASKVLDVGSGLCVFLAELKKNGFLTFCLDPDPLSVEHALHHAGVDKGYTGRFEKLYIDEKFDLITLNKVLEHVQDPVAFLKHTRDLLSDHGFVYIELPEGDQAIKQGGIVDREEFYIEHYTVFNRPSIDYLAMRTGFKIAKAEYVYEPSGKHTIYAFLYPTKL